MTNVLVHNINFHGVADPPREISAEEAQVWMTHDHFLAILDALRGREDVRLSFDDSNRSDVDIALPALLERGMTATFFVLAGLLDDPHHLGADDLRTLTACDMTVGSHGLFHRNWRCCGDPELDEELIQSRRILESVVGHPVTHAAIPFGSYDRRVVRRAHDRAGYQRIFTSDGGPTRDGAWLQPRSTVGDDDHPGTLARRPHTRLRAEMAAKRCVKRWRGTSL